MVYSKLNGSIKVNSFKAYFFFFTKTVPQFISNHPSKLNEQFISKWDVLNNVLKGNHSPLLYELYIVAKYKAEIISYDYEKFMFSLKNIYNICLKIAYPYYHYRFDYWISSSMEYRIEKVIDCNNNYPHDNQMNKVFNTQKKILYVKKIPSSHFVKNNVVIKEKKINKKMEYYSQIGHFKDKSKRNLHGEKYQFYFKKYSNREFRRKNKEYIRKGNYDKVHNYLREVSDIWDID